MSRTERHPESCHCCDSYMFTFDWGLQQPDKEEQGRISNTLSKQLFHQNCTMCHVPSAADEGLAVCDFCKHLQLRHILFCIDWTQKPFKGTYIQFCQTESIKERSECLFCQLVVHTTMPYAYFSGVVETNSFAGKCVEFTVDEGSFFTRIKDLSTGSWARGRRLFFEASRQTGGRHYGFSAVLRMIKALSTKRHLQEWSIGGTSGWEAASFDDLPRIEAQVPWNLVRKWLSDCVSNHTSCKGAPFGELPALFRVIDVRKRCLVPAGAGCRFAALSYVWGRNPDPTKLFTNNSTIDALREEGGLAASKMPVTVEDAMEVCQQPGEDYLWVDRFCIIQDNDDDKLQQLTRMAAIYSLAKFVIISTDGHSDSGIPGVSRDREQRQIRSTISAIDFINEVASWRGVTGGESSWSTRGWTYQEAVLGRRKIILSDAQVFFHCKEHSLSEDGSKQTGMYSTTALNSQPWNPSVHTFYSHLAEYRLRHLTVEADRYNAIDGVASALYGEVKTLWYGLPRKDFDEALLWCRDSAGEAVQYSDNIEAPNNKLGPKPSWSWSSTDRGITLLDNCNRRQIRHCNTLVLWSYLDQAAQPPKLKSVGISSGKSLTECDCSEPLREQDIEKLLYNAAAWSQGCVEARYPFEPLQNTKFSELKSAISQRWSCHHRYLRDLTWGNESSRELSSFLAEMYKELEHHMTNSLPLDSSIIITRAQSALFRLQGSVQQDGRLGDLSIVDNQEHVAGVLIAQDLQIDRQLAEGINSGQPFEFIALSMSQSEMIAMPNGKIEHVREQDIEERSLEHLTLKDSEGALLFPVPVLNVMLVKSIEGVARRVSVGWIYLTSWIEERRDFRVVALG